MADLRSQDSLREPIPRDGIIGYFLTGGGGGGDRAGTSHAGTGLWTWPMKGSGSPGLLTPLACSASLVSQRLFQHNEGEEGDSVGL